MMDPLLTVLETHGIDIGEIIAAGGFGILSEAPMSRPVRKPMHYRGIIATVAILRGVTSEDILGRVKTGRIARARQEAAYYIRKIRPDISSPTIGRWFGYADHTSVLHGALTHAKRIQSGEADLIPMTEFYGVRQ